MKKDASVRSGTGKVTCYKQLNMECHLRCDLPYASVQNFDLCCFSREEGLSKIENAEGSVLWFVINGPWAMKWQIFSCQKMSVSLIVCEYVFKKYFELSQKVG